MASIYRGCLSLVPVHATYTLLPRYVGHISNNWKDSGNKSNLLDVTSDFFVVVDGNSKYRQMVVYSPAAEYRRVITHPLYEMHRMDAVL